MYSIILASHGNMALEMLHSAEMIMGELEGVTVFCLHPGDSVDEVRDEMLVQAQELQKRGELLFLCDIMGGSPFNISTILTRMIPGSALIYGASLPVLIEAYSQRESMSASEFTQFFTENLTNYIGATKGEY